MQICIKKEIQLLAASGTVLKLFSFCVERLWVSTECLVFSFLLGGIWLVQCFSNASEMLLQCWICKSFLGFLGVDQLCPWWFMGLIKKQWHHHMHAHDTHSWKKCRAACKIPSQVRRVDSGRREAPPRHHNASLDANHRWQRRGPTPPSQAPGPGVSREVPRLDWNGNLRKQRFREKERKMSCPDSASLSASCLLPYRCHFLLALSCNYWWQIITFGVFWLWRFRM